MSPPLILGKMFNLLISTSYSSFHSSFPHSDFPVPSDHGLSVGAIVGIVLAVLVIISVALAILWWKFGPQLRQTLQLGNLISCSSSILDVQSQNWITCYPLVKISGISILVLVWRIVILADKLLRESVNFFQQFYLNFKFLHFGPLKNFHAVTRYTTSFWMLEDYSDRQSKQNLCAKFQMCREFPLTHVSFLGRF